MGHLKNLGQSPWYITALNKAHPCAVAGFKLSRNQVEEYISLIGDNDINCLDNGFLYRVHKGK